MWFKQARIFQLLNVDELDSIEEALESLEFKPCLPRLPFTYGWVSPLDQEAAPLAHTSTQYVMLCMQLEEKILPATVVRHTLNEKIKAIEQQQERRVSHKEKYALKDEITQTLLPRAFSKHSRTYAFIDIKNSLLIIDTTATFKVEKFLELFKKSLDEISYHAIETKKNFKTLNTMVINEDCPRSFLIEKSCVLRDPNQQSRVIRCQQQDLSASAIQSLLKDACEVQQLSLNWQDKISCTLVDDFTLKGIQYQDDVVKLARDNEGESAAESFDADFYIMTETLTALLLKLMALFKTKQKSVEKEAILLS